MTAIFPCFSPDGGSLAFASGYLTPGQADVHVMAADGTGERALTSDPGREESVCWSPDGGYLAFQAEYDGNFEIYVIHIDSGERLRLTRDPAGDNWPTWTR